jgi:hypothetical protein
MLVGQTGSGPSDSGKTIVPTPATIQQTQPAPRPILGWFNREDRPVLNRIQSWFKRDQPEAQTPGKIMLPGRGSVIRETEKPVLVNPVPAQAPADFPRKLPNSQDKRPETSESTKQLMPAAPPKVQPASLQPAVPSQTAKSPILPQLAGRIGRDEKFAWITGQIEIEKGVYVIYYASPETVDKFNGRIALALQKVDMSQFHRGDLVSVSGQLVQRPTLQGMTPIYQVSYANLIERPK